MLSFRLFGVLSLSLFLNLPNKAYSQSLSATGELKVLAIMVEFQEDDNEFTSGNGTFDAGSLPYLDNPDVRIDPLPHNPAYFDGHLQFIQNWYYRVSNGQLRIDYHLVPNIYRLDQEMAFYSPTGEEFTFEPLAQLAKDAWTKVDQGPALELPWEVDGETALVIFHAGVGRDIELIGTILDKTFQDIPSISLSEQTLSRYSSILDPNTFRIKNGEIPITNSLLIPRTLSRRGEIFQEEQVVSFSINGLLCASIGSFIGIPDLFNTENGRSGIGRFGLMDAGGFILNYNGLFPPFPSAWERIHLGWEEPIRINGQEGEQIELPAASLQQGNSIARYDITSDEYFLIENRHRDASQNGVTLTYKMEDGSIETQQFTNSDTTFANQLADFDSLLIRGVLIDVDNPDFSLPGGLDVGEDRTFGTEDDRELNGGLLIWHVDESVIMARPNAINADEDRRGIDLEEADGAQDIGKPIEGSLVDLSSGHAFDFWWSGNDYRVISQFDTLRVYQNRFGSDTRPTSANNAGGFTGFELFDISPNQPIATFKFRSDLDPFFESEELISPDLGLGTSIPEIPTTLPLSFKSLSLNGRTYVSKATNQRVELIDASDTAVQFNYLNDEAIRDLYLVEATDNPLPEIVLFTSSENDWTIKRLKVDFNNTWTEVWSKSFAKSDVATPIRSFIQRSSFLVDQFGEYRFRLEDGELDLSPIAGTLVLTAAEGWQESIEIRQTNINGDEVLFVGSSGAKYSITNGLGLIGNQTDPTILNFYKSSIDFNNKRKRIAYKDGTYPALADIDADGSIDLIVADLLENSIVAYNSNGTVINGFPIDLQSFGLTVEGGIKVIKNTLTEEFILLFEAVDSFSRYLTAINVSTGKMLPSFPRSLGAIENVSYTNGVLIESPKTMIYQSTEGNTELSLLGEEYDILWKGIYGNNASNYFEADELVEGSGDINSELLVDEETYNWPNPVQDFTYLRMQSIDEAKIEILVSRPSGQIVYRDSFDYRGDLPFEYFIGTRNWPSGVYLARIQASKDGQTQRKIVKIAVVN